MGPNRSVIIRGDQLEWPIWRTLNRMRTGVGRTKDNMKKWGLLGKTSTTCECGMELSMKHNIMQCPICTHAHKMMFKCK